MALTAKTSFPTPGRDKNSTKQPLSLSLSSFRPDISQLTQPTTPSNPTSNYTSAPRLAATDERLREPRVCLSEPPVPSPSRRRRWRRSPPPRRRRLRPRRRRGPGAGRTTSWPIWCGASSTSSPATPIASPSTSTARFPLGSVASASSRQLMPE
jgi:hypothetical protein